MFFEANESGRTLIVITAAQVYKTPDPKQSSMRLVFD
jgi:hypothetical protein